MKPFRILTSARCVTALLAVSWAPASLSAADQTYDPSSPNGNLWDTVTFNWDGSVNKWTNGNNAIFSGLGETVDVDADLVVGNITFGTSGFTIADATNNGTLSLGSSSVVTVTNAADTATISEGIIAGALTKSGSGTLVLSGANTYTGATVVNGGYLKIMSDTALGGTGGSTTTLTTTISTVPLVTDSGALLLAGGVTVSGETLNLSGSGNNFVGSLQADAGSSTWAGTINLDVGARVGARNGGTLTLGGVIQNGASTSGLAIGAETGAISSGVVIISGVGNTYTGRTSIVRGTLKIGAANALPTGTILDVSASGGVTENATFDLNGFNQIVLNLTRTNTNVGSGAGIVTNSGASASVLTVTGGDTTFSGVIQNGTSTVGLTKSGTGTLTLSGQNTYTGATTVSAAILGLTGSLSGTAITVSGGTLNEGAAGVIAGASSLSVSSGTANLLGANTYTGLTTLSGTGSILVSNNLALGSTAGGTTVDTGSRLSLSNGITVTGETLTINGSGDNSNGALQTVAGTMPAPVSATWAGNIVLGSAGARLGTQAFSTLIVSGVISGATSFDISAVENTGVVVLSGANTWGVTSGTLSRTGIIRGTLRLGASGAIPDLVILNVHSAGTPNAAVFDVNGFDETIAGLSRTDTTGTGRVLNSSATAATLTLGNSAGSANDVNFSGTIENAISIVKIGTNIQTLSGANTYTGSTSVNAGTLQVGGAAGSIASSAFTLNGGIFGINNSGATSNLPDRISNSSVFTFKGGALVFTGSDQTAANSSETIGNLILSSGISTITSTFGSTNSATLTASQFTRNANGGIAFVNGLNLGKDTASTTSVARIFLTTAPTLVGGSAALPTGASTAKDTQIVPYLVGAVTVAAGGLGTAAATPNTFLTYEAGTGLRPLNLTNEFTQNAFATGTNTRITAPISITSTTINSLVIENSSGVVTNVTVPTGQTLTVSSGAILFSTGVNSGIVGGGTLDFGGREGIVTIYDGGNTSIDTLITGTAGVTFSGPSTSLLVLRGQNTYSGDTLLQVNTAVQASSTGSPGAPTSGAFGKGTLILGGGSLRATSSGAVTLGNAVNFAADTTIATAGATDKNFTFTGPVTLTGGNRTLTQLSLATTTFQGAIGDGGLGLGLTFNGTGLAPVVLSGANTYTGATNIKAGTVVVTGSLSGSSAVTVGDAANLATSAILGGGGTIGNLTVGAASGNTGATLQPHAGSASTSTGTTLHTGAVTFSSSAAHLSLQIGRSSAFTTGIGDGGSGGDVSDHVSTTGNVSLNGADLQLSLLTTSYTFVNNDVFFLILNGGSGAIGGTFGSLNGVAATLSEGSHFTLGAQEYVITYQGNYDSNSFSGGNDAAIMAVVPEPSTWVSFFGGLGCLLGLQRFRRRLA